MRDVPVVRVGFADYDHTRDLWNGRVTSPDVTLECTVPDRAGEVFRRFADGEWDAAEVSLASVTERIGAGDDALVLLPVFPVRAFRHGAIWVGAGFPGEPEALAGTRIGITTWTQTSGVFVRGLLASRYGIALKDIRWFQGGLDSPQDEARSPQGGLFDITPVPERSLSSMLVDGQLDAVISSQPPAAFTGRNGPVQRLFAKWTFEEMSYVEATGIYPIMHALAVRREFLRRHPQVADALVQIFTEAKDRAVARATRVSVPAYPLPWTPSNAHRTQHFLGADVWPYGVESSRTTLEAFLRYAEEQGVTSRRLTVEELFAR
ncbi:4,5-dihydroxyphthalate decarboxylase [Streptomyces sp. LamerLS-316]|uniref:4,5-dihydroxyphthalate decarboxylase n=1 Tax=unclassified Streptomyces TaxID=2593676 RepID=UPI000823CC78|nr:MULTISPECIES: 4,5-dihydroxyphthalate decarboxylase [unclassified Streptomyces]MYQ36937.1 4,5-dihydroxyphthalate decarboxylase [Streptomyces sp. SID4921]SCK51931.1 4,5-dihydroxyphthalate decarboxylase [Streptomyces sp. LamerLS-316]